MKNVFSLSPPSLISITNIFFLLLYKIYFFFSFSSLFITLYSSYLFYFLLFSFIFFSSLFFSLVIMSYFSYLLPSFSSILLSSQKKISRIYYSLVFFHFSLFSLISPTSSFFIIQYVAEQLRHLDTTIILSVMRARADSQKAPWVKTIM